MRKAHPYQLENKLSPKLIGLFRVVEVLRNGVYRLETLEGGPIPRTWNAINLKGFLTRSPNKKVVYDALLLSFVFFV